MSPAYAELHASELRRQDFLAEVARDRLASSATSSAGLAMPKLALSAIARKTQTATGAVALVASLLLGSNKAAAGWSASPGSR